MNVASIGFSAALVISIAAALVSSRAEAQNQLPKFDLTNPSAAQLATKKVRVAPNVTINVGKFVSESSLRKHESTKIAFTSGFKRNFLKTPPRYAEKVESLGDRLVVTRTLNLDFKDPCAPGIPAGLGVCFRPTRKRIKPSVAAYLKKTRAKLSALDRKGAKSSKHAGLLKMNDAQLLDALLNKNNSKKVITQTSTVPFVSYDFDKVPKNLNLNNRSQRLPRGISLSPSRVRALRGRSSGAGGSSASPAVGTTEQPAPRRSSKMNRSLRFETDSEHTQPLVMGWTLGRRYGHTYEIEFAEETLLTDRYYARFEFTIGFGVGLRMPLEVTVKSKVDKVAVSPRMIADYPATRLCPGAAGDISKAHLCAAQAKIEVSARAIPESESTEDFYKKAGVITSKLFDGSELVMEGGLTCSFRASIPGPDIRTITCPSYLQKEFSYSFDPRLGSGEHKRLFRHFFDGRDAALDLIWAWATRSWILA